MTDIIQDAKRLLDGATPAPWEWVGYSIESERGMVLDFQCVTEFGLSGASRAVEVTPEDEQLIAAAPELAQSLAEETWEYSAQYRNDYTNGWKFLEELQGRWCTRGTLTSLVEGNLHRFYDNIRIVRRRVSPIEVINE